MVDDRRAGWECREEACLSLLRSICSILDQWILSSKITQSELYFRKITPAELRKKDWKSRRLEVVGPAGRLQ